MIGRGERGIDRSPFSRTTAPLRPRPIRGDGCGPLMDEDGDVALAPVGGLQMLAQRLE